MPDAWRRLPFAALLIAIAQPSLAQEAYGPPAGELPVAQLPPPVAIPEPLDRAASIAAETHPLVEAAEAEFDALSAEFRGARQRRYPSLSVEGLIATRGSSVADSDGIALNAVLEQPLYAGGRISGEISRARASRAAGENRVGEAQDRIVQEVISAYYDYVLADERVSVLTASLEEHRTLLAAIGRRVDQEVSPRADYTLGRSRTAQVALDLSGAEEARESSRLRLFELTGGADIEPVLPPGGYSEILPPADIGLSEALSCSASLAALYDLIEVSEAQQDIARAQLIPQVLLQLSQNEITGTRAALVLRAQLGNGFSQLSAIDSADARIKRALAEYGEEERRLRERLRRDYALVRAARQRIESGSIAVGASAQIIESYQRLFIAGRRSWLDVMNAVRETASARLSESDARVAEAAGTARVLALICRWLPEAGVTPDDVAPVEVAPEKFAPESIATDGASSDE